MLQQLRINNFVLVHRLNIEFSQGMTVITGETGAGKSIAIDALNLCLGQRADISMLREEKERTEVCATFQIEKYNSAYQWLEQRELQDQDNPENCILRRVINSDGRSKAFINGIPVSVTQLKEIGQYLIQINGQHTSQLLLKNDYQLKLLDDFCENHLILKKMHKDYYAWVKLKQQVANFQKKCAENEAKKQLLQYQIEELDLFDLKEGEFNELESEYHRLSNSEELIELSQSTLRLLSEDENVSIFSLLHKTNQDVDKLCELDPKYVEVQSMLQEALIQIQEATSEIQSLSSNIEQNSGLLFEIEQRMSQALQLARKHHIKASELVELHRTLKSELERLIDFSESEDILIEQEQQTYHLMLETAQILSDRRQQGAKRLSSAVSKSIKKLSMENAEFSIILESEQNKVTSSGIDNITFMLKANLGQLNQPLVKVASGGELSRIALALQSLTADKSSIPTLIFDEIDVGISGATASVVGNLLRKLGKKCQVICVTHLPQVACCGEHHFIVEKYTENEKTTTKMTALSQERRVDALAKLLGGSKITDTAIANAQEMLSQLA